MSTPIDVPTYILATISGLAFVGTALLKRAISVGPYRTEPVFKPNVEKKLLRRTPAVLGAGITLALYGYSWLNVPVLDLTLQLPSPVVGLVAGALSDVGYVWLRARVPALDWLTNDSLYRTSPTDAELANAVARTVQPPPPVQRSVFDDDVVADADTEDEPS